MDNEKLSNLGILLRYASVFIPGIVVLLYCNIRFMEICASFFNTISVFQKNDYIFLLIFIVLSFAIGAYLYLFSLRFHSYLLEKIIKWKIGTGDYAWIYWRHFCASTSFTFMILFLVDIFYLFTQKFYLTGILFLLTVISVIKTVLLYLDKKEKCKKNSEITIEKSFDWDIRGIEQNLYTSEALKRIALEQNEGIEKFKSKEKK